MKRCLLLFLAWFTSINFYAQITFQRGYFINNADERIECLIKNIDWRNNPDSFEYKLAETGELIIASIKSVKEFAIKGSAKYIRANVMIDRSSEVLGKLSSDRNPVFIDEQLFLKVLIEGEANLYFYKDQNLNRYFYNVKNSSIECI